MYIGCRIDIRLEVLHQWFYYSFTVEHLFRVSVRINVSLGTYQTPLPCWRYQDYNYRRVLGFRVPVRILLVWKYCTIS